MQYQKPKNQLNTGMPNHSENAYIHARLGDIANIHINSSAGAITSGEWNIPRPVGVYGQESKPVTSIGKAGSFDLFAAFDLAGIAGTWRQFQETAWHTPFQEFEWINTWHQLRPRHKNTEPLVVLGYHEADLKFILPLGVERHYGVNQLVWLASNVNDYNGPLIDISILADLTKNVVHEILDTITRFHGHIDTLKLEKLTDSLADKPNPFQQGLDVANSSCDAHFLTLDHDWNTLLAGLRSVKSRRRLREKAKKLKKFGRVQFRRLRDASECQNAVETILCWKSEQLRRAGDRDAFTHNGLGSLIEKYAGSHSHPKKMRVYGLFLNNELIAGQIAFVDKTSFSLFVTSYDPQQPNNCSVGTILLLKTLELASRAGLSRYDFLAGDEPYKFDWCNQQIEIKDYMMGVTAVGKMDAWVSSAGLKTKKYIKDHPRAMTAARRFNRLKINFLRLFQ